MNMIKSSNGDKRMWDEHWSSILMNLSRSDTVHSTLRDQGVLGPLQQNVAKYKGESTAFKSLVALAHIYGSEDSKHPVQKLMAEHDMSR